MCGIAGAVDLAGRHRGGSLTRLAADMVAAIRHRGPDDELVWTDVGGGAALGQRRLAVVDLTETGRQPMASADGSVVVTYNGEIYNHRALRRELEGAGVVFRGTSDTEVMVELMALRGIEASLEHLNGMFAVAAWEPARRRLWLVRDRLGEKPLYWTIVDNELLFGSELKALRAHPGVRADIDEAALAAYLRFGYVPAPHTILRGVSKLEAGTLLWLDTDGRAAPTVRRWWSLDATYAEEPRAISLEDAVEELAALLQDSVAMRMEADVPVGVFLSGGIDSSTVAALARADRDRIRTFCVGFGDASDETAAAARVARHLSTDHTELRVDPAEALTVIDRLADIYDEPFADPSQVPVALVARAAREHVTVALTGDGGDEVFGGYNRYVLAERVRRVANVMPRPLVAAGAATLRAVPWSVLDRLGSPARLPAAGTKLHKLGDLLAAAHPPARFAALVEVWPPATGVTWHRSAPTASDPASWPTGRSEVEQMMFVDTMLTLPEQMLTKIDRATMASSLEARAPLLDHRVVELAWRLPVRHRVGERAGKLVLRGVLRRHVPESLVTRPKMGFDPPIGAWLRGPLRSWAEGHLAAGRSRGGHLVDHEVVDRAWREHLAGRRNHDYRLWTVLMLEAWLARWG